MTTLARVTVRQFAPRTAVRSSSLSTKAVQPAARSTRTALLIQNFSRRSPFSTTVPIRKGLSPETDNPQPKEAEPHSATASVPVELSTEEYNELSDEYMDTLLMKLEALAEEEEAVDAEYSVCLIYPPSFLPSLPLLVFGQLGSVEDIKHAMNELAD